MTPMVGRDEQFSFAFRVFLCGLAFYGAATLWPDAMSPEVFGTIAYDIDAETWALGFMSCAAAVLYGVIINGRWRWSGSLRIAGFTGMLGLFVTLVFSAFTATHGAVVVIFGALFFIPQVMGCLRSNVSDLRARI